MAGRIELSWTPLEPFGNLPDVDEEELTKLKERLIKAILAKLKVEKMTHEELARVSGSNRPALTQILSGSRKSVTLDKIFQLAHGAGIKISVKTK